MTRWNRRMLFGALAVLVPVLAGCEAGFNAPTLTYHPAAFGAYATHEGIIDRQRVRARVLDRGGGAAGRRVLRGGVAGRRPAGLDRRAGHRARGEDRRRGDQPAPQVPVDLTGPVPTVVLTGLSSPLTGGATITLNFNFAKAGTVTLSVPVEPHAYEYATYSPPPALPTPTPTTTPASSGSASASASPTATP